jgi:hypothetical protein
VRDLAKAESNQVQGAVSHCLLGAQSPDASSRADQLDHLTELCSLASRAVKPCSMLGSVLFPAYGED